MPQAFKTAPFPCAPQAPEHAALVSAVAGWAGQLMAGLGLNGHSLPPVWTVDLVRGVAAGGDEAAGQWQVLKLDCSCVGIAAAQQLAAPLADAAVSHCLCLVFWCL